MTIAACHEVSFTYLAVIWNLVRDVVDRRLLVIVFMMTIDLMPNKSPEPTAVGAVSSASRLMFFHTAWLSFGSSMFVVGIPMRGVGALKAQ